MEKYPRTIREVLDDTHNRRLWKARDLISSLICCKTPREKRDEALLGQVGVARRNNNNAWIRDVAREADRLDFQTEKWIDQNICPLRRRSKAPSTMPRDTKSPYRDVRLRKDPTIEVVRTELRNPPPVKQASTAISSPAPSTSAGSPMDTDAGPIDDELVLTVDAEEALLQSSPEQSPSQCLPYRNRCDGIVGLQRRHQCGKGQKTRVACPCRHQLASGCQVRRALVGLRGSLPASDSSRGEGKLRRGNDSNLNGTGLHVSGESGGDEVPAEHSRHGGRVGQSGRSIGKRSYPSPKRRASPVQAPDARQRLEKLRTSRKEPGPSKIPRVEEGIKRTVYQHTRNPEADPRAEVTLSCVGHSVKCPFRNCQEPLCRAHAFSAHLPGIFDEELVTTEEITRRRISLLTICSSRILGTLNDLDSLAGFVDNLHHITSGEITIGKHQKEAISAVCGVLGLEIPETFTTAPINSPAVMVHWRILMLLLACLGPKYLGSIYQQYTLGPMEGFGRREMAAPKAADSHFHLDRVREKMHLPNA